MASQSSVTVVSYQGGRLAEELLCKAVSISLRRQYSVFTNKCLLHRPDALDLLHVVVLLLLITCPVTVVDVAGSVMIQYQKIGKSNSLVESFSFESCSIVSYMCGYNDMTT